MVFIANPEIAEIVNKIAIKMSIIVFVFWEVMLVILAPQLIIILRVFARRTDFWGGFAFMNITAVSAFPLHFFGLFEDLFVF